MDSDTRDPTEGFLKLLDVTFPLRYRRPLYLITSLLTVTGLVLLILSLWHFALEDHPFLDKTLSYEASVSTTYLSFKLANLRLRARIFLEITSEAAETWADMRADPRNHLVLALQRNQVVKVLRWLMLLYTLPPALTLVTNTLHNVLSPPDQAELMFMIWDPFRDTFGPDWINLRNVWIAVTAACGMTLFGVASCVVMYSCLMAAAQMKVLVLVLQRMDIAAAVRLHQRNLRLVSKINDLFASSMTVELLGNAVVMSLRAYTCISLLKTGDPRFIQELVFFLTILADPFVLCYSGQIITDMSEEVYRGSYQNAWYELPLSDQRALGLLMCRASVPLQLQYRNLMSFNMVRFSTVFQGAYSYITILLKM